MDYSIPLPNNVSYKELEARIPEILKVLKNDKALSDMIFDMISISFYERSSLSDVSYKQLEARIPEILTVLKNDKALSDMILDMINNTYL